VFLTLMSMFKAKADLPPSPDTTGTSRTARSCQ
jgi:hypothetical protein